jgi:hypothetical protein
MANLKSNTLMGENLKKLQHHQWGTITGYANECIVAVLKDELEVLKKQIQPHDSGTIHTTISTLSHRIEELTKETEEDKKDAVNSLLNVLNPTSI